MSGEAPTWGDPKAAFPYCLTYEEYVRQMTEVATSGLNDDQLSGHACIDCGAQLGPDRVKVGRKVLSWRNHENEVYDTTHELYADPVCAEFIQHPSWCDRNHEPAIRGHKWLDGAIHRASLGTAAPGVPDADAAEVEILAHEDDTGAIDEPFLTINGTDLSAERCREFAHLLLAAAEQVDEITGATR